jgi:phage terminase Nu1 subunit (DNA packaging protein)|tara:strand:- start:304 stop:852 length:549 start_codon:yes stop_codon:yes gene_type:complete
MSDIPSYPSGTISKLLDITDRHLRRLVTDGILIRDDGKRGRYPITNVTLYIKYLRERAFGNEAKETDLQTERTRLAKAQADRTEMEVGQLKESLIRSDDVIEKWSELISNCRGKLLNTPAKIAHLVIAADEYSEVEEIIRTEIYEALNELSEQPFTANSVESNTQDIQTTKVNEGQRVGGSK